MGGTVGRMRILAGAVLVATMASGCTGGYLIDSSEEGGQAFVGFVIMVAIFTAGLFYMDRVRAKRESDQDDRESSRR